MKKYVAEAIGTFVLTFLGCGAAVSLGCTDSVPSSVVGTAIAFGLCVIAMAYTIGNISGCHINPAITLGVACSGRMTWKDACGYWAGQVIGGIVAGALLYCFYPGSGLGANGVGAGCNESIAVALGIEVVLTFLFVLVVLGTTDAKKGAGNLAGLAIGLTLILIHLVGIHFTGTSVNPARSLGPAIFAGSAALQNVWIFIVAPLAGGALAAGCWKYFEK